MTSWLRRHCLRLIVHVGSLAPLARLGWSYGAGRLFDPVGQVLSATGRTAIVLLVATLACTPTSTILGWRRVRGLRRPLGLYTFLYAMLHFVTFAWWDYRLEWQLLGPALFGQGYVLLGFAALVLMVPLALTSTKRARRVLGKVWQRLHYLFYPAALLAAAHYLRLGKDRAIALRYAVVVGFLLAIRLPPVRQWLRQLVGAVGARCERLIRSEDATTG